MTICGLNACIVPAAPAPYSDACSWQGWGKHHGSIANPGCQEGSRGTLAPFPHMHCHQLRSTPQFHCHHTLFDYILLSGLGVNTIVAVHTTVSPHVPDYTRTSDSGPSLLLELPVPKALAGSRVRNSPSSDRVPHSHCGRGPNTTCRCASVSHSCMNHRNKGSLLLHYSRQHQSH